MRGNRFILVAILVVIIIAAAAYLYFQNGRKQYLPAALAVPENALVVYQGEHLEEQIASLSQNPIFSKFLSHPSVDSLRMEFNRMDSILSLDDYFKKSLASSPLLTCLEVSGARDFNLLFLHQTKGEFNDIDLQKFIQAHFPETRILKRRVNGKMVYDVQSSSLRPLFSFTFMSGIIAISSSPVLVEDAVSAFSDNKFRNNSLTDYLVEHQQEERLFLNYHTLPDILNVYSDIDQHAAINKLDSLTDAGAYELNLNENGITLQGNLTASRQEEYFSIFNGQSPVSIGLANVVPASSSLFMEWGANSASDYYGNYKKYLSARSENGWLEEYSAHMADSAGINIENDILPLLGNDWGYSVKEPLSPTEQPQEAFYIRTADTATILDRLQALNDKITISSTNIPTQYRGSAIHYLKIRNLIPAVYGRELLSRFERPYYTRIGSYIVFANDLNFIERIIDDYLENQTLASDKSWQFFSKNLSPASNFLFYLDPARSVVLGNKFVRRDFLPSFVANIPYYKAVSSVSYQLSSSAKGFTNQIQLQKAAGRQGGSENLWTQTLEADAISRPFIVSDNGNKNILVEDANFNLYKFSPNGNMVWKVKLDGPIKGDIYTTDFYGNQSVEYLFSTQNKVHLLAANGSETGGYPLRLSAPTETGLTLFNLDPQNGSTYYVCTANSRVYGFNLNGQPLMNWSPQVLDSKATLPIKYFSIAGKNYLFTSSLKGLVYVWDESGKQVIKPIDTKTSFTNLFHLRFGSDLESSSLFSVDTSGALVELSLKGGMQRIGLKSTGKHSFFDYLDTDGNGKPEYIVSGNNKIISYNRDASINWKFSVSSPLIYPPQFVNMNNETWIGYAAVPENMIYLRSRAGTPFEGFPVKGNRDFAAADVNNDGGLELVTVGDDKKIYLYKIGK